MRTLAVEGCETIVTLPDWLGDLTSLRKLVIRFCTVIKTLPDTIQKLPHLQHLEICGCDELVWWCKAEETKMKLAHIEMRYICALTIIVFFHCID